MSSSKSKPEISIGDYFKVKRQDGTYHWAAVVESRKGHGDKRTREHYVHYEGCDRRLDEWISRDRIELASRRRKGDPSSGGKAIVADDIGAREEKKLITRGQKRRYDEINHVQLTYDEMDPTIAMLEKEHEAMTKVKYIDLVQFGKYEMKAWYFSPYPEEYGKVSKLWVCEYCLRYMKLESTFRYHLGDCVQRQPPGYEIYRKGPISVYEIDGTRDKIYCQCMCLLSKLFLDHKTLFFDVEPFLFYVVCEVDREGAHFVGYFSKEKSSPDGYNLACIMILPPFQRKGYGKFLIQLSYELAKRQKFIGSPEKPLSDLGKLSYRSYWAWALLEILINAKGTVMMKELIGKTCIAEDDVIDTLQALNIAKYWKGHYVVCVTPKLIEDCMKNKIYRRPTLVVDTACLRWPLKPQVVGTGGPK